MWLAYHVNGGVFGVVGEEVFADEGSHLVKPVHFKNKSFFCHTWCHFCLCYFVSLRKRFFFCLICERALESLVKVSQILFTYNARETAKMYHYSNILTSKGKDIAFLRPFWLFLNKIWLLNRRYNLNFRRDKNVKQIKCRARTLWFSKQPDKGGVLPKRLLSKAEDYQRLQPSTRG